jgi:hypothetical protein
MDRIFATGAAFGDAEMPMDGLVDNADDTSEINDYHTRVRALVQDARDYNDNWLAPVREENTEYYQGVLPAMEGEGKSSVVATEVRDTVMAMLPSLMRIFTGTEHVVEYIPRSEQDVELANQATEYVSYIFWNDNPGYLTLQGVIKDALIRRTGIVRWDTVRRKRKFAKHYRSIDMEQVQLTLSTSPGYKDIQLVPADPDDDGAGESGPPLFDLSLMFEEENSLIEIEAVAPDEFRVDRNARNIYTAKLVGYEQLVPASDLVAMGYDKALVDLHKGSSTSSRWNQERILRNPALSMDGSDSDDQFVAYGEYYVRIDSDGDGVDELHLICVMGNDDEVVDDIIVDRVKMAVFSPEPEPHTVVGESTAELVTDLQRIKTGIMRGSLDSLAATIQPRLAFNETTTNIDDVLNDDVGAPIRTKGDPGASIQQLAHTFIGEPAFNMLNYLDLTRQQRTGISDASKGLDPSALQSTNVKGVDMVITGAQERIELVARNLCETGMAPMFKGLLQEITESPPKDRIVRLRNKFVQVNPSLYDATMDVQVNPAIGKASDSDRMLLLSQIKATQEMIVQQMGLSNPLVGPVEYRNTIADMLAIGNIRDVSRYFKPVTQQQVDALAQQMSQHKEPAQIMAEAEAEKVRATTAAAIGKQETQRAKNAQDDDFRRDKMEVDSAIKIMELNQSQDIQSTTAAVRAATDAQRISAQERLGVAQHVAGLMDSHAQRMQDDAHHAEQLQHELDLTDKQSMMIPEAPVGTR